MIQLFMLPGPRRGALSRVWIEGNPKQPLARVWVDREMRIAREVAEEQEEAQPCCA